MCRSAHCGAIWLADAKLQVIEWYLRCLPWPTRFRPTVCGSQYCPQEHATSCQSLQPTSDWVKKLPHVEEHRMSCLQTQCLEGAGNGGKIVGPSTRLALLQGFARNLTGPLRLSSSQHLPQQTGEAPARAQNALAAQQLPALQRHAMSQLSPRGALHSTHAICRKSRQQLTTTRWAWVLCADTCSSSVHTSYNFH